MDHREAKGLMLDLTAGRLDRATRDALEGHIADCDDCRAWLETYDLLAAAFAELPTEEHPDSRLLALCAVRSEEEYESDRADLHIHLEICHRCRREIDLVRRAVLDARPVAVSAPFAVTHPNRERPRWAVTLAASVAAAAVVAVLVTGVWRGDPDRFRPSQGVSAAAATASETRLEAPLEEVSQTEIEGTRLIESQGGLVISHTKIKDGAQVTIRATKSVAFGNGFQIGQRTRMAVGGTSANPVTKPRKGQNG